MPRKINYTPNPEQMSLNLEDQNMFIGVIQKR
jgi:hypothetical protein